LIGEARLKQLQTLPMELRQGDLALVHAAPGDLWKSPMDPSDAEALNRVYRALNARMVVYGHIHRPFIRKLSDFTVCNSGSVGMPYDGDPRASYLLLTDGRAEIRRVEYDIESEAKHLLASAYPYKEWFAEVRARGAYVAPQIEDSDVLRGSEN
jgi:hypothetical protein